METVAQESYPWDNLEIRKDTALSDEKFVDPWQLI